MTPLVTVSIKPLASAWGFSVFVLLVLFMSMKYEAWKRLCKEHSEVSSKIGHFKFEGRGQKETPVCDKEAADICAILELPNVSKALDRVDEEDKRDDITVSDVIGRQQQVWCINESGLYSLVLTSRKPQAKTFKKWLTSEVIPSIRKTGSYSVPQPKEPVYVEPKNAPEVQILSVLPQFDVLAETDPRLAQHLKDSFLNRYLGEKAIAPTQEIMIGAVECADKLGYKTDLSSRTKLGRFLSVNYGHLKAGKESRLCNGVSRPINVFKYCVELEQAVHKFFEAE